MCKWTVALTVILDSNKIRRQQQKAKKIAAEKYHHYPLLIHIVKMNIFKS